MTTLGKLCIVSFLIVLILFAVYQKEIRLMGLDAFFLVWIIFSTLGIVNGRKP